jgi:hypothetical protein
MADVGIGFAQKAPDRAMYSFRNPIPTSEILLADCGLAWLESGELSEGEKSMKQRIVLMLVFVLSLTALTWGQ